MSRLHLRTRAPGRPRTPVALALPALLAIAFLLMPLIGILARTEWGELGGHLSAPGVTQALKLSMLVSFWALGLSLLLGVPLAWLLARVDFPGKAFVRSLVLLPMVLPPTVGGVALLLGFGRRGLLGPWLESTFGIVLPFHTSGAVVAATFVSMPFLVISLEGALGGLRPGFEETAASLGASPVRVFFTVTMPMVAPGLIAGAALTWARALGEFGATITFAGNLPGTTQTLPLQVYLLLQDSPEAATSLSLLLLAIAMAVLVGLRGRWSAGASVGAGGRTGAASAPEAPDALGASDGLGAPGASGGAGDRAASGGSEPLGEALPALAALAPQEKWGLHADVTGADELTLDAAPGTTIAVVGPNGAGKTTLLRALLGLTPRAHARLRLGDHDVTALPPHRRGVAWVPQEGALFPHLNALGNTAYGLRAQGVRRARARQEARAWLDRLGVGHLAHRKPGQLSGGQAQRVALARALAARPRLLLLDEPLAALDQTTRAHVRHTLRRHLEGFGGVCLIVTHDPVEAVSLADRVLVLDEGRTLQDAPPAEVTRHPRSPWVARMLGRNAWPGTVGADGTLVLAGQGRLVVADAPAEGTRALAVIAPEAVSVHRERPQGSPRNVWRGTVREVTTAGSRLRVLIVSGEAPDLVAEITPQAAVELGIVDGAEVWTSVKATEVSVVTL
ncbi:molybdate ABC transporter permease subunit [Streptomyces sp. WAC 01529]|uniref:ABC transporter permease n=1 Tax=Streptomyces sp. WAC 01529 TaxID=2203205 RepID=UPI000F6E661E|nr:ABC transporter permease [Streptomyces sp. WAC 01529]AZM53077.1 molybdate ABC transporter permease subunit [Streptomyces sp. WAC 01529]